MDKSVTQMNVTPLIDVLLVLLILFVITVPVVTHQVGLDLPHGPGISSHRETINVDIDFDGKVFWNGAPSPSDRTLEQWFRATHDHVAAPNVRIYPDKRAPYERVAQVLAAAQRAHVQRLALDPVAD
jgi:biopolymer transport protein ExbD